MNEFSDQELLARVTASDAAAFTELLRRHWNSVYSHALAYLKSIQTAEEITQDVFLNIWQARGRLHTVESFRDYLFITARNRIFNETRKKIIEFYTDRMVERSESRTPDQITEYRETFDVLLQGIAELPEKRQQVFRMSRLEGMSNDQIAAALGMHRDTVYQYLTKAVSFLKIYLRDHHGDTALFLLLLGCTK